MIGRREFLRNSMMGASALVFARSAPYVFGAGSPADSRIEILLNEPLGTISPEIYGHFTEHLGGVIYDGIWVGENSKVPNVNGLRKELVDEMKKIKAPVIRYPGGCFADSYDWRDGIGSREKRPKRTNFWGGPETNHFGTNEFVQFCKLIGAQPYLAANVRSLTAKDFYSWVEYCNSPAGSTTLADERAAAGFSDPFNVRYWGVGNESWGCGGNFTPQEYAVEFRRFVTWVPGFGENLSFIASGASDDQWSWTRGFLEELVHRGPEQLRSVYGMGLHYYTWNLSRGRTRDWNEGKGDALKFDVVDWYELLREADVMESLVNGHWQVMGEFDKQHHIKLIVDEWGAWYKPGSEMTPGDILEQTPTLRDALLSGLTLDTFNRHPEKVAMANSAQLINCLNSLYLAHEDKFCITPIGHVFDIYSAHQRGQSLRTVFSAPDVTYDRDGKPASFWGLKGSASLHEKELVVTVVNPHVTQAREAEVGIRGASVKSGSVTTLSHTDIHAHNSFDQQEVVKPQTKSLDIKGPVRFTFPAASVSKLTLSLA
ncbi:MAG TPA: alpha-L-arabinofuranosidase C-terminal domain-containing protein [Terriglobales bacterium]